MSSWQHPHFQKSSGARNSWYSHYFTCSMLFGYHFQNSQVCLERKILFEQEEIFCRGLQILIWTSLDNDVLFSENISKG